MSLYGLAAVACMYAVWCLEAETPVMKIRLQVGLTVVAAILAIVGIVHAVASFTGGR